MHSLMAIYAHPDDESYSVGGVLAKCASRSIPTYVVCATRGEVGEIADPSFATPETLGKVRERELREACHILGVKEIVFLDYIDGQLDKVDPIEAQEKIVRAIRQLKPQVVVTFEPEGVYGHPDHKTIHKLATEAFYAAGDSSKFTHQFKEGLTPIAPERLYYNSMGPRSHLKRVARELRRRGIDMGWNVIDVEKMGDEDRLVTTRVSTRRFSDIKLKALLAHRTQMPGGKPFRNLPDDMTESFLSREYFIRVYPPYETSGRRERDIFQGLN